MFADERRLKLRIVDTNDGQPITVLLDKRCVGSDVDDRQRPTTEFWHTEQQVQHFVTQRAVVG